jgi:hypothetical protein
MVILMARLECPPYSIGGEGNGRLGGTDKAPGGNARQLGGPDNKLAVHQDVVDSDREFIGSLPGRAVRDPSRIEYRDVRGVIRSDAAAGRRPVVSGPEALYWLKPLAPPLGVSCRICAGIRGLCSVAPDLITGSVGELWRIVEHFPEPHRRNSTI